MKHPISWHEECLENQRRSYFNECALHRREAERLFKQCEKLCHYADQIEEAKRRGLDGFDRDNLMKGKRKEGAK